jgi:hypothetical protein
MARLDTPACSAVQSIMWKIGVLVALVLISTLVFLINWRPAPSAEYIGEARHDGGENCWMHDWPPTISSTDIAVQVRGTECNHDVTDGSYQYFVFVRPPLAKNSANNLVFRYLLDPDVTFDKDHSKFKVHWARPTVLRIVVQANGLIESQKMRLSNVTIDYKLPQGAK